jgi:hypothetical protein
LKKKILAIENKKMKKILSEIKRRNIYQKYQDMDNPKKDKKRPEFKVKSNQIKNYVSRIETGYRTA